MMIFVDVDTQNDFMNKNGALYVPGAEAIKPKLKEITDFAKQAKIKVYKTLDFHTKYSAELKRNGGPFPDHCMKHTYGVSPIPETNLDCISFSKDCYDIFDETSGNQDFAKAVTDSGCENAVVYGVATDYCVRAAVLGLLERDIKVTVVKDAIAGVTAEGSMAAIMIMSSKGASILNWEEIQCQL